MSNYRRHYVPGGVVFLTLVTFNRNPIFADPQNVSYLRHAMAIMKAEMPFDITAAVVLPDHLHLLLTLPPGDSHYSKRAGRLKVLFTQRLRGKDVRPRDMCLSRQKHRESNVWQRRFWEHTIRDEADWIAHVNYIHYNPVKHGLVRCPREWEYSSFHRFVKQGMYISDWGCGNTQFLGQALKVGE